MSYEDSVEFLSIPQNDKRDDTCQFVDICKLRMKDKKCNVKTKKLIISIIQPL